MDGNKKPGEGDSYRSIFNLRKVRDSGEVKISRLNRKMRKYTEIWEQEGREGLHRYIEEHPEEHLDDMEFLLDKGPEIGYEIINRKRQKNRFEKKARSHQQEAEELQKETNVLEEKATRYRGERDELREKIKIDGLTQLYNRGEFERQLQNLKQEYSDGREKPVSLMLFDIDLFKDVNDTYGHKAGDYILIKVSEKVKENIRGVDSAFRYGGEEIGVILDGADYDTTTEIGERVRESVENLRPDLTDKQGVEHKEIMITISGGGSTYDPGEADSDFSRRRMVNYADNALYSAKGPEEKRDRSEGRNKFKHYNNICENSGGSLENPWS